MQNQQAEEINKVIDEIGKLSKDSNSTSIFLLKLEQLITNNPRFTNDNVFNIIALFSLFIENKRDEGILLLTWKIFLKFLFEICLNHDTQTWAKLFSMFMTHQDSLIDEYMHEFLSMRATNPVFESIWKTVCVSFGHDSTVIKTKWAKTLQIAMRFNNYKSIISYSDPKDYSIFLSYAMEVNNNKVYSEMLMPSLSIVIKCNSVEGSLSSYSAKFSCKENALRLLNAIKDEYQKGKIAFLVEVFRNTSTITDELQQIESYLKLRKILRRLFDSDTISTIIPSLDFLASEVKQNLIFALSFDFQQGSIVHKYSSFSPELVEFYQQLAVTFSPLFFEISNEDPVIKNASQTITRNKRTKQFGFEYQFLEKIPLVFENPVLFCTFCIHGNVNIKSKYYRLTSNHWNSDDALKYLDSLFDFLSLSDFERSTIYSSFIDTLSFIQVRIIKYMNMNSSFIYERFFDICVQSINVSELILVQSLNSSLKVLECTPDTRIEKKSVEQLAHCIKQSKMVSNDSLFSIVVSCCNHLLLHHSDIGFNLISHSLSIIENYLQQNPCSIYKVIDYLLSIHSFSFMKQIDSMNSVLDKCFLNLMCDKTQIESIVNSMSILFFTELFSSEPMISNSVKQLFSHYFATFNISDLLEIRVLSMYPSYYILIIGKYNEFFECLYAFLFAQIQINSMSSLFYELIISILVDICIKMNDSNKYRDTILPLKLTPEITSLVANGFKRLLYRLDNEQKEIMPIEKPFLYEINEQSLQTIIMVPNSVMIKNKTSNGSNAFIWKSIPSNLNHSQNQNQSKDQMICTDCPVDSLENDMLLMEQKSSKYGLCFPNDKFGFEKCKPIIKPMDHFSDQTIEYNNSVYDKTISIYNCQKAASIYHSLYPDEMMNFFPSSANLDPSAVNLNSLVSRELLKIGVIYVSKNQREQNSILKNEWHSVSSHFKSFLGSIGSLVDLTTHQFFNGKLDSSPELSNGRYHLFFMSERFELMYHVAPLIPTDHINEQQIYKKRHIGNDNVHIVWSENEIDYDPQTISSQFNDAHIIIYPLKEEGLCRVFLNKKNPNLAMGPLFKQMLVTHKSLPYLVVWSAIIADRIVRASGSEYCSPQKVFENNFQQFCQKTKDSS